VQPQPGVPDPVPGQVAAGVEGPHMATCHRGPASRTPPRPMTIFTACLPSGPLAPLCAALFWPPGVQAGLGRQRGADRRHLADRDLAQRARAAPRRGPGTGVSCCPAAGPAPAALRWRACRRPAVIAGTAGGRPGPPSRGDGHSVTTQVRNPASVENAGPAPAAGTTAAGRPPSPAAWLPRRRGAGQAAAAGAIAHARTTPISVSEASA